MIKVYVTPLVDLQSVIELGIVNGKIDFESGFITAELKVSAAEIIEDIITDRIVKHCLTGE